MSPQFRFLLAGAAALALACQEQRVAAPAPVKHRDSALVAAAASPVAAPARAPEVIPPHPAPPKHPNFLLITLDTVRFDVTAADPRTSNATPFIDELAHAGVNFVRSYSTFDGTPQSHFSMLTGFVSGWGALPLDVKEFSLPFQLRRVGYRTFGIAANGNLSAAGFRQSAGFQQYTCLNDVWDAMPAPEKSRQLKAIDARLDHYAAPRNDFNRLMLYSSANEVLPRLAKQLDRKGDPFFGFINLIDAHDPYFPDPKRYDARDVESSLKLTGFESDLRTRKLTEELTAPEAIADEKRRQWVVSKIRDAGGRPWSTTIGMTKDGIRAYRMRYRAEVRELDQTLRAVFAMLRERGLLDSTIVVVTSDHGEAFGESEMLTHSFGNKGDREATHRIPLLFILPPAYGASGVQAQVETSGADVAPTLYDLAGVDWAAVSHEALPGNFGKSLVPYFGATIRTAYGAAASVDGRPNVTPEEIAKSRSEAEKRLRSLGYIR
jgi:arylsulfatase A-like enzyme